jgi:hypothetical protein
LNKKTFKDIFKISIFISITLLLITIIIGGIYVILNIGNGFVFVLGFPHPWVQISHYKIDEPIILSIYNWNNLVSNIILYFVLVSSFTYLAELLLDSKNQKHGF